jgi:hypothetical protein
MSDTVVRRRLFWSFFILGTEKWLGGMSSSGLHLCSLDFSGSFSFKRGEPHKYRYVFSYAKFEYVQKKGNKIKTRGWEEIAHQDKWSVYRGTKSADTGVMPNRRGLFLHNNSLLCLYALLSSIALLLAFGVIFGIFAYFSRTSGGGDIFFRNAIGIIGIFALMLLGNFVVFLYMTSLNNRILEEPKVAVAPENAYLQYLRHKTFETWLEKLLIRDGDIVKRIRPLWILSPRGFEKWLARMELKGLNVYKIHRTGFLFYFIKSAPRNIRYCIVNSEGEDISHFLEGGWRVVYSSVGRFWRQGNITLLALAYEGKAPLPFKNEKEYIGNAARIMLRAVSSLFILLIVSLAFFFALIYFKAELTSIWIFGAAAAVFALLIVKMLFYFASTVKSARSNNIF